MIINILGCISSWTFGLHAFFGIDWVMVVEDWCGWLSGWFWVGYVAYHITYACCYAEQSASVFWEDLDFMCLLHWWMSPSFNFGRRDYHMSTADKISF